MLGEVKGTLRGIKVEDGTFDATKELGMLVGIVKEQVT